MNTEYNFKRSLLKSQEAVEFMGNVFKQKGFDIRIPELVIAPYNVGAFSEYADQGDMFISKNGKEWMIEVKHVSMDFTPTTYKYRTLIVNSYTGYNSKIYKPDVHIILNKDRTYYISVREQTSSTWVLRRVYDKIKKDNLLFYFVDIDNVEFFKI
jgi:hypothetical protein